MDITQKDLVLEYFMAHPNRDISHITVVPWLMEEYKNLTGKAFADPDRQIRSLYADGVLQKIKKGVYRYDPNYTSKPQHRPFTQEERNHIFVRDKHKCVFCGKGKRDGIELHADHVKPRAMGGESTIDNGQTLCAAHNYMKKHHGQYAFAKKVFVNYLEQAKQSNQRKIIEFCKEILEIYDKYGIDSHIR